MDSCIRTWEAVIKRGGEKAGANVMAKLGEVCAFRGGALQRISHACLVSQDLW